MSAHLKSMSVASAVLLAACATSTNNPNYQYSTKYKNSNPHTIVVTAETQATTTPVVYTEPASYQTVIEPVTASYTRVDAECLQAGNVVPCDPQVINIAHTEAVITPAYKAPTDKIYADQDLTGTPGYHAVQSADPRYTYPETVKDMSDEKPPALVTDAVTLPSPTPLAYAPQMRDRGTTHTVVEGDTVYSFARKLCTSLDEIGTLNNLDGNFSLRVDDTIRLPASRC